jgi:probable phosphoglycerate mutase
MNQLFGLSRLHNRYFLMRHGESEANCQGIILSDPQSGVAGYGLSAHGRRQVIDGIGRETRLDANTLIYSSDFKRALETARIVHQHLCCKRPLAVTESLRERFFGNLEKTSSDNYEYVWAADATNASHAEHGVEPAVAVMQRAASLVLKIEQNCERMSVLLVAHGDVLQLLQTALQRQPGERHRSLPHLDTAEIREVTLAHNGSLPAGSGDD